MGGARDGHPNPLRVGTALSTPPPIIDDARNPRAFLAPFVFQYLPILAIQVQGAGGSCQWRALLEVNRAFPSQVTFETGPSMEGAVDVAGIYQRAFQPSRVSLSAIGAKPALGLA